MQEWLSFENEELSKIELSQDSIIPDLKLSYLHLSPNLKPCFAYCSLFPKNYEIARDELIGLWIAQGYVESSNEKQSAEEAGHGYFMELVRRFFFEKAREDIHGEVCRWKVHDLIHDLTQNVAGMETSILSEGSDQVGKQNRHLSVVCGANSSWNIQTSLLIKNNRIRSFLFVSTGVCSLNPSVVDQLLTKFNFLRSLCLKNQGVEDIPCSIGELKHLRYLDLSNNNFSQLPDSITKLVNLLTLDIFQCGNLQKLPGEFRKLVNLRQLDAQSCFNLRYMPSGFEELTCLQNLYCFKVGKATRAGESSSRVDALAGLNLKGYLQIEFDDGSDDWNGNECIKLPTTITELEINYWPWMRIPSVPANLVELCVYSSSTLKHLPPLRLLPRLKILELSRLDQLEYIEDDDDENESEAVAASANLLFFPCLEKLLLYQLPRLKGWSRHVESILAATRKGKATLNDHHLHQMLPLLPVLSALDIFDCEELKSMPLLPRLKKLQLHKIPEELVLQLLSPSLHSISHSSSSPSSYMEHLKTISISDCSLSGFPGVTCASLRVLELESCKELKHLYLTSSQCDALEVLRFEDCPMLELWDEEKRGVDWDSFPNLREVVIIGDGQKPTRLPDCLQRIQEQGRLKIIFERSFWL